MRSVLCMAAMFLCAWTALAQGDRGTITGTVSDPAGAMVPGARVEAEGILVGGIRDRIVVIVVAAGALAAAADAGGGGGGLHARAILLAGTLPRTCLAQAVPMAGKGQESRSGRSSAKTIWRAVPAQCPSSCLQRSARDRRQLRMRKNLLLMITQIQRHERLHSWNGLPPYLAGQPCQRARLQQARMELPEVGGAA